jgi:hypothetical protein
VASTGDFDLQVNCFSAGRLAGGRAITEAAVKDVSAFGTSA